MDAMLLILLEFAAIRWGALMVLRPSDPDVPAGSG
jgi:hypothetical protein